MPKKKEKDIFQKIEGIYGPIPACLKEILKSSGFDNGLSIELLDENAIKDIERYIQENGENVINALQCCNSDMYKSRFAKDKFEFAPGHKYTILAIAEKAREMHQNEIGNVNKNRKETVIVSEIVQSSSKPVDRSDNEQVLDENSSEVNNNITVATDVNTECELKLQLLNKLKEAMRKSLNESQFELNMNESHVIEMEIQMTSNKPNGSSKCVCAYCGSSIQATCVNGKWRAHNVVRHLRNHFVQKKGASSTVAKITNDESRWQPLNQNSPKVHSAVAEAEETVNRNEKADKMTDETRWQPLYQNSPKVHSAVAEAEETVNRNEKSDKMTDFEILKTFDPLFQ